MQLVAIVDRLDDLPEVHPSQLLVDPLVVFHDVIVHVATVAQFENEKQSRLRVYNFVQPNDMRVLNQLHAPYFLEQVWLGNFVQLRLVDHFNGNLFAGEDVSSEFDNRKMPLPDRFFQVVQTGDVAAVLLSFIIHTGWATTRRERSPYRAFLIKRTSFLK